MAMMTRNEPFSSALPLREAMGQLLQESFVAPFWQLGQANSMPVDLYETDDAFVVKGFAPGLTAADLTISIEQQVVTIHGERKMAESEGLRLLLQERPAGAFTRTFSLPGPVDAGKVEAKLVDGVLSLTLPKSEAMKPRHIQIKSS
jgi:HSP20 family protein